MTRLFILVIFFLTFVLPANAQQEKRLALVIGNAKYSVKPLFGPDNDAYDVAKALERVGFTVALLVDADYQSMETALANFQRQLNKQTTALFYYSGHGLQHAGQNYLMPVKGTENIVTAEQLKHKALTLDFVLDGMSEAKLRIIVMDACRDSPFKSIAKSGGQGLASSASATGAIIAYAAAPGKIAYGATLRNSPYTAHFLRYVPTPGLPLPDVFRSAGSAVQAETANRNPPQHPWYADGTAGYYYLAGPVKAANLPSVQSVGRTGNTPNQDLSTADLQKVFNEYINAWRNRRADIQVAYLANDFEYVDQEKTVQRQAFTDKKRELASKYKWIAITATDVKFSATNSTGSINYFQHYSSDQYESFGMNTLYVRKANGRLEIYKEKFEKNVTPKIS